MPPLSLAWTARLLLKLQALLIGGAVLLLVPHSQLPLSEWGSHTMFAYLLQHDLFAFISAACEHWLGGAALPDPRFVGVAGSIAWMLVCFGA